MGDPSIYEIKFNGRKHIPHFCNILCIFSNSQMAPLIMLDPCLDCNTIQNGCAFPR